jgi:D-glycerate 3-kinase
MAESPTLVTCHHVLGWLRTQLPAQRRRNVPVLAISGAQGAGKTTLLRELVRELRESGYQAAALSLDDFYLPRVERLRLARDVHPLFATRGVPGTHDVALLETVLRELRAGRGVSAPVFDKATDDRAEPNRSIWIDGAGLDLIVLEGWCLGLVPEPDAALVLPINDLERLSDPGGVWRGEVNHALATSYRRLFAGFTWVVALLAPDFDAVFAWRREQELALAATLASSDPRQLELLVEPERLRRFIAHFERLTRHALCCLPKSAQLSIYLDEARGVLRSEPGAPAA